VQFLYLIFFKHDVSKIPYENIIQILLSNHPNSTFKKFFDFIKNLSLRKRQENFERTSYEIINFRLL